MPRYVPIRRLNQQTSAVIEDVAAGHAVTITSGGRPVARLVPIQAAPEGLQRLIDQGLVIAPTVTGPFVAPARTAHSDVEIAVEIARERADERS